MNWFGGDTSLQSWVNHVFGPPESRQAGEASVEAKARARRDKESATIDELLRHTALIGPKAGRALANWPVTDGSTLGNPRNPLFA